MGDAPPSPPIIGDSTDGITAILNVTTKIIDNMIKKGKLEDPTYKYYGKTRQEILDMWAQNGKEASSSGTKMHTNVEYFYSKMEVILLLVPNPNYNYFNYVYISIPLYM